MTYYSKKRGVKKSFKNGKVKSRLSFKNKNKKNRKNKKTRTRRRNRRLNGGTDDDILKTLNPKINYTVEIFNQDLKYAFLIICILFKLNNDCNGITLTDGENKKDKIEKHLKSKNTGVKDNYVKIFVKNIEIQTGGARPIISPPITVKINNESIQVNAEVVNELRIQLQKDQGSLSRLESLVNTEVPEVQPPTSGDARIPDLATINAEFARFKAEYERDKALAELEEVKAELEAAEAAAAVDLLSRHVVDHIVEKNLSAVDEIRQRNPALFQFLESEGRTDVISSLVDINALLER